MGGASGREEGEGGGVEKIEGKGRRECAFACVASAELRLTGDKR